MFRLSVTEFLHFRYVKFCLVHFVGFSPKSFQNCCSCIHQRNFPDFLSLLCISFSTLRAFRRFLHRVREVLIRVYDSSGVELRNNTAYIRLLFI